jgi:hypothetical protein
MSGMLSRLQSLGYLNPIELNAKVSFYIILYPILFSFSERNFKCKERQTK